MLHLHRIQHYNEFLKCRASGEILMYGDFYLTDDDGKVISYNYYHNQKKQKEREEFDETILNNAKSQKEYQDELQLAERELLTSSMLNEPIDGHWATNFEKEGS